VTKRIAHSAKRIAKKLSTLCAKLSELYDLLFPLPLIPSSPRRRLYEPDAARGGETDFLD
jgi:hypothetical protein